MSKGIKIKTIKKIIKESDVYDFEVKDAHHYLFSNGIVSHNSYVPMDVQSGGSGPQYNSSTTVFLSKSKVRDESKEVVGNVIKAKLEKSRLTIENSHAECLLNYRTGLNRYYGLTEIALDTGVFVKGAKKIELPNGETVFEKYLILEPEKYFTDDVLKMIDEKCKEKFLYGRQEDAPEKDEENELTNTELS